jgi:hypothetical protein
MNLKKSLLLFVLLANTIVYAQIDSLISHKNTVASLKLSYNSSIVYPGLRIGVETLIKRTNLSKTNKSGFVKNISKDRLISANLSWYHHPTFHDNVYLSAGYTLRRISHKGFFTEFTPEIGYSRVFVGATTYLVNDDGSVSVKKINSYGYALLSIGASLGYDFSKTKSKPLAIFYKFNLISLFPYNSHLYLRPVMELGINYTPKKLFTFNSKIITKSK